MGSFNYLPHHYPLNSGSICLSQLSAREVSKRFPGMPRIKPCTYFGEDFRIVGSQLGILDEVQLYTLYERVEKTYRFFWPNTPFGRFHCYESTAVRMPGLCRDIAESVYRKATVNPNGPGSGVITITLGIPKLALTRTLLSLKRPRGTLELIDKHPIKLDSGIAFVKMESTRISAFHRTLLDIESREREGKVWLSLIEYLLLPETDRAYILKAGRLSESHTQRPFPTKLLAEAWEQLSISAGIAHEARLIGELSPRNPTIAGTWLAGAERAYSAIRFKPVIESVPTKNVVDVRTDMGRLIMCIEGQALITLLAAAYRQGLLPLKSFPQTIAMNWSRHKTAHDSAFEMLLHGHTDDLLHTDVRALEKGGVLRESD